MRWQARLSLLAAALWWGSLTAIGFLAVPLLFSHASSPAVAGSLAARLFTGQNWLGLACGAVLLMGARSEEGTPRLDWAGGALVFVLLGMLAALLQEFAIAPRIVARENLQLSHSAGTVLYALQWLCALAVLWKVSLLTSPHAEAGAAHWPGSPGSPPPRE